MEWAMEIQKEENRCPRCLGMIPNNSNPGAYPGAVSRLTRDTASIERYGVVEICSACGADEAIGLGYVPISLWPVRTESTPEDVVEHVQEVHLTLLR